MRTSSGPMCPTCRSSVTLTPKRRQIKNHVQPGTNVKCPGSGGQIQAESGGLQRWTLCRRLMRVASVVIPLIAACVGILEWTGVNPFVEDVVDASPRVPHEPRPVPLVRCQAPRPATANTLTVTGGCPSGWTVETSLGFVYLAGEERIDELVPVSENECISSKCTEDPTYSFSVKMWKRADWDRHEEAFRCFPEHSRPPEAVPLIEFRHPVTLARTWAVQGTHYYSEAIGQGFDVMDEPVCYIWPQDTPWVEQD